jgi:hypothetical protein
MAGLSMLLMACMFGAGCEARGDALDAPGAAPTAPVTPPTMAATSAPAAVSPSVVPTPTPTPTPTEGVPPVGPEAALPVAPEGDIVWTAPAGWASQPPASSMRRAQFAVPGIGEAGAAECAVFHFPGGGDVDDNIARWLAQFEGPSGAPVTEPTLREQRVVNGLLVTVVEAAGTFLSQNPPMSGPVVHIPDSALFGAVITTTGAPYFVKCTGPAATIVGRRAELNAFVDSFAPVAR